MKTILIGIIIICYAQTWNNSKPRIEQLKPGIPGLYGCNPRIIITIQGFVLLKPRIDTILGLQHHGFAQTYDLRIPNLVVGFTAPIIYYYYCGIVELNGSNLQSGV